MIIATFNNSAWVVHTPNDEQLIVNSTQVYPNHLNKPTGLGDTYGEYFASPEYGERLTALVNEHGLAKSKWLLGLPK